MYTCVIQGGFYISLLLVNIQSIAGTHTNKQQTNLPDDYEQQHDPLYYADPLPDECQDYSIMDNTIPVGEAQTPHRGLGRVEKVEECIKMCCDEGSERCQYAWVFQGICYGVLCNSTELDMCSPKKVAFHSTYVRVRKTVPSLHLLPDDPNPTDENDNSEVEHIPMTATIAEATPINSRTSTTTYPDHTSPTPHQQVPVSTISNKLPIATPPPTKPPPIVTGNNHLLHKSESKDTRTVIILYCCVCV